MPTRNLVSILLALIVGLICYQTAQRQRYASTIGSAMSLVEERALEPRTRQELFYAAMDGMMRSLDEHSAFIDPDRLPALNERLDQEFGGVGIVVERNPNTQEIRVLTPMLGSPAAEAGIRSGDVILSIDDVPVEGLTVSDMVTRIRGPRGTSVKLELRPDGSSEERTVSLERRLIPVESVVGDRRNPDGSWDFTLEQRPATGFLRIKEFGDKTSDEVAAAIVDNPFHATGEDKQVHTHFLECQPPREWFAALIADQAPRGRERLAPGDRALYIDFVDGVAGSKLTVAFIAKRLGCRGTARNMRSLARILEKMDA